MSWICPDGPTSPRTGTPDWRNSWVTFIERTCKPLRRPHEALQLKTPAEIYLPSVLAGQHLGIKEVNEGIWFVSFMHFDLGYIDLEQKTLQTLDNPFGQRLLPMS